MTTTTLRSLVVGSLTLLLAACGHDEPGDSATNDTSVEDTGTNEEDTASDGLDTASGDANPDPDTDVGEDPDADVVDDPDAVDTNAELVDTNQGTDAADTDAEPVYTPEEQVDAFEAGCAEAAALYCDAAFDPACAGETSHLARLRAAVWSTPPALDAAACAEGVASRICTYRSGGILEQRAVVDVEGFESCLAEVAVAECAAVLAGDFLLLPCDTHLLPASEAGDPCSFSAECINPDHLCVGDYTEGICAEPVAEGEPCVRQGCAEGLVCIDETCRPMLGEGEPCVGDVQCERDTLYCSFVRPSEFVCAPKGLEGAACASNSHCDWDLYCSVDNVCTAVE